MDTTKLDDLLNEAEAQEENQIEWTLDQKYDVKNFYVDEHGIVDIKNKSIGDMSKHISVKGESYSQYIEFKMNRFYDGIDLVNMLFAIYYDVPNVGSDESKPINVYYNETEIKFGWAIPVEVAQTNLTIDLCIYARGKLSDGNDYVLKTKTATYQINDGLDLGGNILKPTNNWYLNFVLEMDEKIAQANASADIATQSANRVGEVEQAVSQAYEEVSTMHTEVESMRNEVERMKDQVEDLTGVGIAAVGKLGVSKPDGETIDIDEEGTLRCIVKGTTDYQVLENKPSIAGIELNGDKSYDELGLASKDAVARNFQTVNQSIQDLDDYTQSLGEDIISLDTELDATNEQLGSTQEILESTTKKLDEVQSDIESGFKKDAQGEEIHITDAVDGKTVALSLFGKSKQKTLSGKNLIPYPHNESNKTRTGVTFTDNGDGTVHVNGTNTKTDGTAYLFLIGTNDNYVLAKGTYVISGTPIENNSDKKCWLSVTRYSDSVRIGADKGNGETFTLEEDTQIRVAIIVDASATANNLTFKPMLRLASIEDDTYEPYTGGYPSPNPEYPQPIESSGGKGFVEVKSVGKNLIPYPYQGTSYSVDDGGVTVLDDGGIKFLGTTTVVWWFTILNNQSNVNPYYLPKGTYTLSVESTTTANPISIGLIDVSDGSSIINMNLVGSMYKEVTFTIDEDANIAIRTFIGVGKTVDTIIYPMLRLASDTDNTYEPYKETKSIILTPNGLSGIKVDSNGNYTDENGQQWITDEIVKFADGSGQYIQRICKAVFDGSNDEAWVFDVSYSRFRIAVTNSKTEDIRNMAVCSHGIFSTSYDVVDGIVFVYKGQFFIYNTKIASVDDFKAWLSENNVTVYYELAEPIITPLTAEELSEIDKLQTFKPITNISNNEQCGMSITYGTTQEALMLQEALNGSKANAEEIVDIKKELSDTTFKVDTIIEKADLGIKETASGEEIHLTDSAESKVREFALFGKATQNTTSGKNLIPYPYNETTHTDNGITWTDNGNGTVTANGETTNVHSDFFIIGTSTPIMLKAGTYALSGCPSGGVLDKTYFMLIGKVVDGATIRVACDVGQGSVFTLQEDSLIYVLIRCQINTKVENLVFKPMLRLASITDDTWEQPTNGATPRPDYPQEIEVSGESGSVEVKSTGKNLIPYPYSGNVSTDSGITWKNENGIITTNGTATSDATYYLNNNFKLPKGNYILSGCPSGGGYSSYRIQLANNNWNPVFVDLGQGMAISLTEDIVFQQFRILIPKGVTANNLVFKPMIRLATDTDATWQPYREPKLANIPTPNGLAGIPVDSNGNYTDSNGQQWICDEIVKYADGSGALIQRVAKKVFKGTDEEVWNLDSSISEKRFLIRCLDSKYTISREFVLCSHGKFYTSGHTNGVAFLLNSNFYLYKSDAESVDEFKTWLSENNMTICYELSEPIRTPLTAEQIAEIEKLCTFYPVTNISNDADCGMGIKYLVDSKNYVDKKLELQAKARGEEMMAMFLLLPDEVQAAMIENDTNNLLSESEE